MRCEGGCVLHTHTNPNSPSSNDKLEGGSGTGQTDGAGRQARTRVYLYHDNKRRLKYSDKYVQVVGLRL